MAAGLHFTRTVEAGGFVFVSGQLGFEANGAMAEGVSRQTVCCLDNMAAALAERGLHLTDVVKTTVWLRTDADFTAFNETYAEVFGNHKPARSTVVSAPARPDALIEIEAVAYKG